MTATEILKSMPRNKTTQAAADSRLIPANLPPSERELARKLYFDSMHNFRDLGGYQARDGLSLKWGLIYRADKLAGLSEEDQRFLERLNIRRVVDFRSDEERYDAPHTFLAGSSISVDILPVPVEAAEIEKVTARLQEENVNSEDIARFLIEANREMIERFTAEYKQWLHSLLIDGNLPQVFHCTAGKDRTGLAAALLMRILGVSPETIMVDYMATNTYTAERVNNLVQYIHQATMHQVNEDVIRTLFRVQERYLNEAFNTIDEHYGSFSNYLTVALEIDETCISRLREIFLETEQVA
jgi:protein-tyrosine phosphatase